MGKDYIYPHVNMTTRALPRRVPVVPESNATTLLAPFTCGRGPENVLVPIDTLADFERYFGELEYSNSDQRQILNIGKWLAGGGRVLACRITEGTVKAKSGVKTSDGENGNLVFESSDLKTFTLASSTGSDNGKYTFRWEAKYSGKFYNDLSVEISQPKKDKNLFNITVKHKNVIVELRKYLSISQFYKVGLTSEYIGNLYFCKIDEGGDQIINVDNDATFNGIDNSLVYIPETLGTDVALNFLSTEHNLVKSLAKILKQPLETPFDVMLDCGYAKAIKEDLIYLFTGDAIGDPISIVENVIDFTARTDAFLMLSEFEIKNTASNISECQNIESITRKSEYTNIAVYDQLFKVIDLYSATSGKEVFVPMTYFLSELIPYNDAVNGTQYPVAGKTRGIIKGALWVNMIPSNHEKNEHYLNGINYAEKDSRGMYVMTNLTYTSDDTALKFVNNSRSLLKIKRELESLGRRYLHEFNDRITKTNLHNTLNTEIANWIQNRTLAYGNVELFDYNDNESLTNEELLIQLDIRFTGTIEIISIDITVE